MMVEDGEISSDGKNIHQANNPERFKANH